METEEPRRLLIVVNDAQFFLSHRLNIALHAKSSGFQVNIACPTHESAEAILRYGFTTWRYDVQRGTSNFSKDCLSVLQLLSIFLRVRPDVVHLVTAKPVIFGGVIARLFRVPIVAAITGLGYAYSIDRLSTRFLRIFMNFGYRLAIKHARCTTIFQNSDNMDYFKRHNMVGSRTKIIKGSGTKLEEFNPDVSLQENPPIVLMPCRMLATKGVLVFIKAARIVNQETRIGNFVLAGALDPGNPAAVSAEILQRTTTDGVAQWIGYENDIASLMAKASIVVLPSFYNEGLPKTLIDAAAAGRPVITTDTPGCRDAIVAGETGLLVIPQDEVDLASKITELLLNPRRQRAMGVAGRKLAEMQYCDAQIAKQHVSIYDAMIDFTRDSTQLAD